MLKWNVFLKVVIGLSVPLLGSILILAGAMPILGLELGSGEFARMLMPSIAVSLLLILDVLNAKDNLSALKIIFDRVMLVSLTVTLAWIAILALQQGKWQVGVGLLAIACLAFQMILESIETGVTSRMEG
jgi:hypothetical protein